MNVKGCTKINLWLPDSLVERLRQASQQTGITQVTIAKRAIERELAAMRPVIDYSRAADAEQ